jgi:site-specific DNA recombinase
MTPTKLSKNKNVAVGYCRVSSDEQADKGISLDYQDEQCRSAAEHDGYTEVLIIKDEGKTGKNLKRKGIQEVMDLAKKKEIAIVYVTNADRLARNIGCHTFIRHALSSNGVELRYLNGQSSGDDAGSVMADNMFATVAQYHSDITREKSMQATDKKARAGYFPTHAPVGYINCSNPDKNCEKVAQKIIIPDPKTAPLVTEAFRIYASGQHNAYELNEMLHEKGLVTQRGKKLPDSVFYNILKNRLYLGEIHWQGIHVKNGKHEPLIDEDTFNRVQTVMNNHGGNRCRRRKYSWLLNGYVFCPLHNRRYTAEFHCKKLIAYYHCPNREGCGKYVERSDLEGQVASKFKDLEFSQRFISSVISKVKAIFRTRRDEYQSRQRAILNSQNSINTRLQSAEQNLLDGVLPRESYMRIREESEVGLKRLNERINKLKKVNDINIDLVSEVMNFTNDLYATYLRAPEHLQKKLIGFFFEGFDVKNGVIIKTRYSQMFEELLRFEEVVHKSRKLQKPPIINVDSKVIIRPLMGAQRESDPQRRIHRPGFYH